MASTDPVGHFHPTSPNKRDDELRVPFQMRLMKPSTRPAIGQRLRDIRGDSSTQQFVDDCGNWKLRAIGGGSSDATLVFRQDMLPTAALEANPSDFWDEYKNYSWPAVIRGQPTWRHQINDGNYYGTTLIIDEVKRTVAISRYHMEIWWTTAPWPEEFLVTDRPRPDIVWWRYPGSTADAKGQRSALHDLIEVPPLTGIKQIRGQSYNGLNTQGWQFVATNQKTWVKHVYYDDQKKINGVYRRIRQTVFPPWNALKYPAAGKQYTS